MAAGQVVQHRHDEISLYFLAFADRVFEYLFGLADDYDCLSNLPHFYQLHAFSVDPSRLIFKTLYISTDLPPSTNSSKRDRLSSTWFLSSLNLDSDSSKLISLFLMEWLDPSKKEESISYYDRFVTYLCIAGPIF